MLRPLRVLRPRSALPLSDLGPVDQAEDGPPPCAQTKEPRPPRSSAVRLWSCLGCVVKRVGGVRPNQIRPER